jgi:hypothetical protein
MSGRHIDKVCPSTRDGGLHLPDPLSVATIVSTIGRTSEYGGATSTSVGANAKHSAECGAQ